MGRFGRTFFTADTMFGDEMAAHERDFSTVAEMDDAMIACWNASVGVDDIVWVLGGFATANAPDLMNKAHALNGRKYLIAGQADKPFWLAQKGVKGRELAVRESVGFGFTSVVTGTGVAKRTGRPISVPLRGWSDGGPRSVVLSPWPYDATELERGEPDRFKAWRPKRGNGWLLHGHTAEWVLQDQQINVGADKWGFEPVDAETVVALIEDAEKNAGAGR